MKNKFNIKLFILSFFVIFVGGSLHINLARADISRPLRVGDTAACGKVRGEITGIDLTNQLVTIFMHGRQESATVSYCSVRRLVTGQRSDRDETRLPSHISENEIKAEELPTESLVSQDVRFRAAS